MKKPDIARIVKWIVQIQERLLKIMCKRSSNTMVIEITTDGIIRWHIYRKAYKKARWRRAGQRELNCFLRFKEQKPLAHGLIIIA